MNSRNKSEKSKQVKSKVSFEKVKSDFFLKKIFDFIKKHKSLDIVRYNKKFQKLLEFNINDYIENFRLYSSIIIELKIDDKIKKEKDKFINISYEEKDYYHIYFDNSSKEIKRNYLEENEKVKTIKIIINYQVKSLKGLFQNCTCISSIIFKQFIRNNIIEMDNMFNGCILLKELNLSNCNTEKVTNMGKMFFNCF